MATRRICSVPDCGKAHYGHGYCSLHWYRWRKHGDPRGGRNEWGAAAKFLSDVVLSYQSDECLLWPFSKTGGGYALLYRDGSNRLVSHLVCEHSQGPRPSPSHEARHLCGKGHEGCVTPKHLVWSTHAENMGDKLVHGTSNRGERHGNSALTEPIVRQIRSLQGTMSESAIARRFGVSRGCVNHIHRRATWGWLD